MKAKLPKPRRGPIKRYIETDGLLVILQVPVIYASEAPTEPLLEAKTIKLLDEASRRAKSRDVEWLRRHGRVFEVTEA